MGFRYGSDGDRDKLSETFRMLGHKVKIFENLSYQQMHNIMKIMADELKQYDALVICILSHGEKDSIFTSDCIPVKLDDIKNYFGEISSLVEKPKLFFMQACQGEENQSNFKFSIHVINFLYLIVSELFIGIAYSDEKYEEDGNRPSGRPSSENFFEGWATVPGYCSYRSTSKGDIYFILYIFYHNFRTFFE